MRAVFAFALLASVSLAFSVDYSSTKKVIKGYYHSLTTSNLDIENYTTNEDVKQCGLYSSGCQSTPVMSVEQEIKLLGMMHNNPVYLDSPSTIYAGPTCMVPAKMLTMRTKGYLDKNANDVKAKLYLTIEDSMVTFWMPPEAMGMTCIGIVVGEEVSVKKTECVDDSGSDPFEDGKKSIGTKEQFAFTFRENSMDFSDTSGSTQTFPRVDDDGCVCFSSAIDSIKRLTMQTSATQEASGHAPVNERVKQCGQYTNGCAKKKSTVDRLIGMTYSNPVALDSTDMNYFTDNCVAGSEIIEIRTLGSMDTKSYDVKANMYLTYMDFIITFHVAPALIGITCDEKIVIGDDYNVKNLHCKTMGQDPFAELKWMLGQRKRFAYVFRDESMDITNEAGLKQTITRIDDDGCSY